MLLPGAFRGTRIAGIVILVEKRADLTSVVTVLFRVRARV